jgi:hypothetical protein
MEASPFKAGRIEKLINLLLQHLFSVLGVGELSRL